MQKFEAGVTINTSMQHPAGPLDEEGLVPQAARRFDPNTASKWIINDALTPAQREQAKRDLAAGYLPKFVKSETVQTSSVYADKRTSLQLMKDFTAVYKEFQHRWKAANKDPDALEDIRSAIRASLPAAEDMAAGEPIFFKMLTDPDFDMAMMRVLMDILKKRREMEGLTESERAERIAKLEAANKQGLTATPLRKLKYRPLTFETADGEKVLLEDIREAQRLPKHEDFLRQVTQQQ
jgi:hypothetical protein